MKPYTYSKEQSTPIFKKYGNQLLAFLLAVYSLPVGFSYTINASLDGSWIRALNVAIKNELVFGRDIIFTYGPLSYFSTRYTQYIHNVYLLFADIFLCTCFYYISYLLVVQSKKWFYILLIAIFYFKGYEYAASLFLFFIVFTVLNLKNDFKNYLEVAICAVCGVVVFFVKVNYGIVSLPIIAFILIMLLIKNRKSFMLFISVGIVVFVIIYSHVNIDIINYIKFSLPMISCYNEAMQITVDICGTPFKSLIIYFIIYIGILLFYFWQKNQNPSLLIKMGIGTLITLMLFLAYKNGFTRADEHTQGFFSLLPIFTVFSLFLLDFLNSQKAVAVCLVVFFISDLNVDLPHGGEGKGFIYKVTLFYTTNYFKTLFSSKTDRQADELTIPTVKRQFIGNKTIDIFPVDVTILQLNNMNYSPRPIIQSYSAYSPVLDSLNANHFYFENQRPELVMIKTGSAYVDNRYVGWEEPLTHAILHLNYRYIDFVSLNNDTSLVNTDGSYLLLASKGGIQQYPKFEKMYEREISFNDTVHVNFKDETPVYMSVEITPSTAGKIKNILYQAPVLSVSFFLNDECTSSLHFRVVRPIIKAPVLISNIICDNLDYREYMNGNSGKNAKVKAFAFYADSWGYENKMKLTFYRFVNY